MVRHILKIRNFLRDESGPTSVEYAVILMLILLALITSVQLIGGTSGGSWEDSADQIDTAFNS